MTSKHVLVQLAAGGHVFCFLDPEFPAVEERGCPKIFLLSLGDL